MCHAQRGVGTHINGSADFNIGDTYHTANVIQSAHGNLGRDKAVKLAIDLDARSLQRRDDATVSDVDKGINHLHAVDEAWLSVTECLAGPIGDVWQFGHFQIVCPLEIELLYRRGQIVF